MSEDDREQVLELRKARNLPWHSPPHLDFQVAKQYILSSSCYDHVPVIGKDPERMTECEAEVAYFLTITMFSLKPNGLVNCEVHLGSSMDALPSNGIKVMASRAAKSGTTALKDR
jgi:hypothetical protein